MVSLTSLLVLASLFSQTSETIPKTAYLKLIDIWYIVLIMFDFLVIMDVVIIEHIRLGINSSQTRFSSVKKTKPDEMFIQKMNKYSEIIFCIILIIFLVTFASIGFSSLA